MIIKTLFARFMESRWNSLYLLFLAISANFLLAAFLELGLVPTRDAEIYTFGFCMLVFIAQMTLVRVISLVYHCAALRAFMFALLLVWSFQSLLFWMVDANNLLSVPVQWVILVAVTTALWLLLYGAEKEKRTRAMLCLLLVGVVMWHGAKMGEKSARNLLWQYKEKQTAVLDEKWKLPIAFQDTPNLHLVSFDAMIPQTLAREFIGVDAPYQNFMEQRDAYIFPNLFSSYTYTRTSLNSLLWLASEPHRRKQYERGFFSGEKDSPLYHLFREQGYSIAAGFQTPYLGRKGEYIDEYTEKFDPLLGNRFCFSNPDHNFFFGICSLFKKYSKWTGREQIWSQEVIETLQEKATTQTPWLTFHYLLPHVGHTKLNFQTGNDEDLQEYREQFAQKALEAVPILQEMLDSIHRQDPDAIIFIFGDHGAVLTRSMAEEENPEFFAQDQHGVFGAIEDNNQCKRDDLEHYRDPSGFTTLERVMAGILRCLAENPLDVDNALDAIDAFHEDTDFSLYLYE